MKKISKVMLYLYDRNVIKAISQIHGIPAKEALRRFLFSETYRMLCDESYEMIEFSYPAILDIWESENNTGDPRNSVYIKGE